MSYRNDFTNAKPIYLQGIFANFLESKWQDFDWESYIKKDITKVDLENPTKRFTINLINSIKVGVNRTIPDYRYDIEHLLISGINSYLMKRL